MITQKTPSFFKHEKDLILIISPIVSKAEIRKLLLVRTTIKNINFLVKIGNLSLAFLLGRSFYGTTVNRI